MKLISKLTSIVSAGLLSAGALAAGIGVTATPAFAATCTTSAASGNCGPYSDPNVYTDANGSDLVAQDVWNQIPGWQQTLTANNDNNWNVQASMPNGNTAVVSYPDTQITYTLTNGQTPPMSNFGTSLNSTWSQTDPTGPGMDYEWAYDIWLNPAGTNSWNNDQEIMIWTDNHGQRPAGDPNGQVYTDASGVKWDVWTEAGSNAIVSFVREGNASSGGVDLMGFMNWLKTSGHTVANAGFDQIDYGPEICSTGGALTTFALTGYTLVKNGTQQAQAPAVTTSAASGLSSSGATLNGSVNPEGQATTYQFDYGTDTSYGSKIPATAASAGSGSSAVNENAALTGLQPSTTYHYRIEATNATGTTLGSDQTFTTSAVVQNQAPTVVSNAASGVSSTGATLNGSVNPNGAATTYQFDYGTDTSYGSVVPAGGASAGSGTSAVNESATLSGLTASSTYHYRIEATNATGTSLGADQTFTTSASGGTSHEAFVSSATAKKAATATLSWTHNVTGTHDAIVAEVAIGKNPDNGCFLSMTDNGIPMQKLAVVNDDNQHSGYVDAFGLVNPPFGTDTLTATVSNCGSPDMTGGSMLFSGVNQSAPFGTAVTAFGSGSSAKVTTPSNTGDFIAAAFANGSPVNSIASPATSRFIANLNSNTGAGNSAGATSPGTGSNVTPTAAVSNDWWGAIAVPVIHE